MYVFIIIVEKKTGFIDELLLGFVLSLILQNKFQLKNYGCIYNTTVIVLTNNLIIINFLFSISEYKKTYSSFNTSTGFTKITFKIVVNVVSNAIISITIIGKINSQ